MSWVFILSSLKLSFLVSFKGVHGGVNGYSVQDGVQGGDLPGKQTLPAKKRNVDRIDCPVNSQEINVLSPIGNGGGSDVYRIEVLNSRKSHTLKNYHYKNSKLPAIAKALIADQGTDGGSGGTKLKHVVKGTRYVNKATFDHSADELLANDVDVGPDLRDSEIAARKHATVATKDRELQQAVTTPDGRLADVVFDRVNTFLDDTAFDGTIVDNIVAGVKEPKVDETASKKTQQDVPTAGALQPAATTRISDVILEETYDEAALKLFQPRGWLEADVRNGVLTDVDMSTIRTFFHYGRQTMRWVLKGLNLLPAYLIEWIVGLWTKENLELFIMWILDVDEFQIGRAIETGEARSRSDYLMNIAMDVGDATAQGGIHAGSTTAVTAGKKTAAELLCVDAIRKQVKQKAQHLNDPSFPGQIPRSALPMIDPHGMSESVSTTHDSESQIPGIISKETVSVEVDPLAQSSGALEFIGHDSHDIGAEHVGGMRDSSVNIIPKMQLQPKRFEVPTVGGVGLQNTPLQDAGATMAVFDQHTEFFGDPNEVPKAQTRKGYVDFGTQYVDPRNRHAADGHHRHATVDNVSNRIMSRADTENALRDFTIKLIKSENAANGEGEKTGSDGNPIPLEERLRQLERVRQHIVTVYLPILKRECELMNLSHEKWKQAHGRIGSSSNGAIVKDISGIDRPSNPFPNCYPNKSNLDFSIENIQTNPKYRENPGLLLKELEKGFYLVMDLVEDAVSLNELPYFLKEKIEQYEGVSTIGPDGVETPFNRVDHFKKENLLVSVLYGELYRQVEDALGFLHRDLSLVHNDVQGGNIMIKRSSVLKLLDFIFRSQITNLPDVEQITQVTKKWREGSIPVLKVKLLDFGLTTAVHETLTSPSPTGYAMPLKHSCLFDAVARYCRHLAQPEDDLFALNIAVLVSLQVLLQYRPVPLGMSHKPPLVFQSSATAWLGKDRKAEFLYEYVNGVIIMLSGRGLNVPVSSSALGNLPSVHDQSIASRTPRVTPMHLQFLSNKLYSNLFLDRLDLADELYLAYRSSALKLANVVVSLSGMTPSIFGKARIFGDSRYANTARIFADTPREDIAFSDVGIIVRGSRFVNLVFENFYFHFLKMFFGSTKKYVSNVFYFILSVFIVTLLILGLLVYACLYLYWKNKELRQADSWSVCKRDSMISETQEFIREDSDQEDEGAS